MSLKSFARKLSQKLFDDDSWDPAYSEELDQNSYFGGIDIQDFLGSSLLSNAPAGTLGTNPSYSASSNSSSSDLGQLVLLGDDDDLSHALANSGGRFPRLHMVLARTHTAPAPTLVGPSGGLQFNLIWDRSVSFAPVGLETAAIYAASLYTSYYSNPEVINIHIGYGEVDGHRLAQGVLGTSMSYGYFENYSQLSSALTGDASSSTWQSVADASLPSSDPTNGGQFFVSTAEAKALGQVSGTCPATDGYVGLSSLYSFDYTPNTTPGSNQYDAVGTFAHEFTEIMGRVGSLGSIFGSNIYTPLDLFRYASPGVRDLTPGSGYFSVDGGSSNLGTYNNPQNGGDASDWIPTLVGDSYGSGYKGVVAAVSPTDIIENSVLGYLMTPTAVNYTQQPKLA